MSVEKQQLEARRWLRQADDDLEASRALEVAGKYAQAAFFAQQAGEKALKAVWLALDADPWGRPGPAGSGDAIHSQRCVRPPARRSPGPR